MNKGKDQNIYKKVGLVSEHGDVKVRKATAEDKCRIEAEIELKTRRTFDIMAELNLDRKPEKKPSFISLG